MADAARRPLGRDARVMGLVGTGHFLSHFYHLALPPLFPLIKIEFGLSYAALGLIITVFNAAAAAAQLPIGFLVDRIGGRAVLIGGLLVEATAIGAVAFVSTYEALLALALLAGLGHSVFHPADYAILISSVDDRRIGRAFSTHNFAGSAGSAAAPAAVIFLAALWSWQAALTVVAAVGVATALVMLSQTGMLKDDAAAEKKPGGGTAEEKPAATGFAVLFSPPVLVLFLFFLTTAMIYSGLQTFLVTALIAVHGASLGTASSVLTAFLIAVAAGIVAGGVIADRIRRQVPLAAAAFIAVASIMFFAGAGPLPPALLVALFVAAGLLLGLVRPVRDMMVRAVTPTGAAGKVFGFMSCGQLLGGTVTPVLLGWIIDMGAERWVFWLIGIFAAVSLATIMMPRSGRQ